MTDADVLRRAAEIMKGRGWPCLAARLRTEAAEPPPTLEEALREYDRVMTEAWGEPDAMPEPRGFNKDAYRVWNMARAALAAHGTKEASREA